MFSAFKRCLNNLLRCTCLSYLTSKRLSKTDVASYDTADCDFQPPEYYLSIIYLFMCKIIPKYFAIINQLLIIMILKSIRRVIRLHRNTLNSETHDTSQLAYIPIEFAPSLETKASEWPRLFKEYYNCMPSDRLS